MTFTDADIAMMAIAITDRVTTRRQAIAMVREEADWLIEQAQRRARGFDKGAYRDDDTDRTHTIEANAKLSVTVATMLSRAYGQGNARNAPSDSCGDFGMADPDAECGPIGCGAKAGEPCKPDCEWAQGYTGKPQRSDRTE